MCVRARRAHWKTVIYSFSGDLRPIHRLNNISLFCHRFASDTSSLARSRFHWFLCVVYVRVPLISNRLVRFVDGSTKENEDEEGEKNSIFFCVKLWNSRNEYFHLFNAEYHLHMCVDTITTYVPSLCVCLFVDSDNISRTQSIRRNDNVWLLLFLLLITHLLLVDDDNASARERDREIHWHTTTNSSEQINSHSECALSRLAHQVQLVNNIQNKKLFIIYDCSIECIATTNCWAIRVWDSERGPMVFVFARAP